MNLTSQIETLKQELREFIVLSEKITPGKWHVENITPARHDVVKESGGKITSIFRAHDGCHEYREAALPDATFIARSRNISPAMAECLLVAVEALERVSETRELVEHGDDNGNGPYVSRFKTSHAQFTEGKLQQILTIWEACK